MPPALLNSLSFATRRLLRWQRGAPALRQESKDGLYDDLLPGPRAAAERRERQLRERYGLGPLEARSTRRDYRENLYLLDALEQLAGGRAPTPCRRLVDVGARNWSYVFGLRRYFEGASGGDPALLGVEVDGHGVYPDLRSRCDHARAYAAQAGGDTRYLVADFLDLDLAGVDAVTLLYPFVFRQTLLRWGLPAHLFQPAALLERAVATLRPGGWLVVFNQTEAERDRAIGLAERVGAERVAGIPLRSRLAGDWPRTRHRTATLLRRLP